MVDPVSVVAGIATTVILPKVLDTFGANIGEAAWEKSGEVIQATREFVQTKLQATGTAGLLARAEANPTEANVQVLEAELVSQMEEDREFAARLTELVNQIQSQSPAVQVILDKLRIRGKLDIGNITQIKEGQTSAKQLLGRDWQVGSDAKVGDITQENRGDK
ncbi:hypothetical protein QUA27_04030 [Microcoleus sp. Pol14C6]|uniref:hypothetical protein n=1 Tax=unclassified Microcoleus TaxID=2642155 RepID=UPI002FD3C1A7